MVYLFPRAAIAEIPQMGWLKQWKCTVAQSWRLEIQDQGVSRGGSFPELRGRSLAQALLLGGRWTSSPCVSSPCLLSLHVSGYFFFFLKDTRHWTRTRHNDLGTPHTALLVKDPPASAGDLRNSGSIPGSRRSPGGRHGNPLHYSCLLCFLDSTCKWCRTVVVFLCQTCFT